MFTILNKIVNITISINNFIVGIRGIYYLRGTSFNNALLAPFCSDSNLFAGCHASPKSIPVGSSSKASAMLKVVRNSKNIFLTRIRNDRLSKGNKYDFFFIYRGDNNMFLHSVPKTI